MALREPQAGLRPVRLYFDSNQPHKTTVLIPAGAELEVPEAIASVLRQNPHFKPVTDDASQPSSPAAALGPGAVMVTGADDAGVGKPVRNKRARKESDA
jgi:hypothetical protein